MSIPLEQGLGKTLPNPPCLGRGKVGDNSIYSIRTRIRIWVGIKSLLTEKKDGAFIPIEQGYEEG